MRDLLKSMPEQVRRLVDVRGECWIDRNRERGRTFSSVAHPFNSKRSITIRRATVEAAGLTWKDYGRYRSICGEPACVHPEHVRPAAEVSVHEARRERISYATTRELCGLIAQLLRRGLRPAINDKDYYTRNGEFRVLPHARVIEIRDNRSPE